MLPNAALLKKLVPHLFFIGILCVALFIRVQGGSPLPENQFAEPDAYLYWAQALTITTHGYLPPWDMQRWLPLGRDNRQLLSLYAYGIAYAYKTLRVIFPKITHYQVQLYAPSLCFTLGLGILFLFFKRTHGILFAALVTLLLATLPGSVDRSSVGFGDRDAWCWMLGTLSVISYLWKEQMALGWRRWLITTLSGFLIFLGGLSWEGFGVFLLIILSAELWKFYTTDTEEHLKEYILWGLMFVPWLYLISPAYRSGYGFSTHVASLMLAPPIALFILRIIRHVCIEYSERLRVHSRKLAVGLTLLGIATGVGYFFLQADTFAATAFPFQESEFMKSIDELSDPNFPFWVYRYGSIFVLGSLGFIIQSVRLWKWKGVFLSIALTLFTAATFFRQPLEAWIGSSAGDSLFFSTLVFVPMGIGIASRRRKETRTELITLIAIMWFFLWVALARGGKRYDFFIGVPLVFSTVLLLSTFAYFINRLEMTKRLSQLVSKQLITTGIAISILVPVVFLAPQGGNLQRSVHITAQMRQHRPGQGEITKAFKWMKSTLPQNAIVAADWTFGSQLNVLAGVKTIIDQDHYIPHWVVLYNQHVRNARFQHEALEFLKTHGATHIMSTQAEAKNFQRGSLSHAFKSVYPKANFADADVKIWKIYYPPHIKTNPKYLATQPEYSDEQ